MAPAQNRTHLTFSPTAANVVRIGCVSYLNSKPLIDGLESPSTDDRWRVRFDVPSRLLDDLENQRIDLALCPVIDYHRSRTPLRIVPVGGVVSDGPTLTVRLFSRTPFEQVQAIHADTDSRTSVVLARVLLAHLHNVRPQVIDFNARRHAEADDADADPPTVLLIGDKVVAQGPTAQRYPYQMDLGEAWRDWTGLPFVFAVWMARKEADIGGAAALLDATRRRNQSRIDEIVKKYASHHGWPVNLARDYLVDHLQFEIGPREMQAMRRFAQLAAESGWIEQARPLVCNASP